jgi:hypothetical protein
MTFVLEFIRPPGQVVRDYAVSVFFSASLEAHRRCVVEQRVSALSVVEDLDVLEDRAACRRSGTAAQSATLPMTTAPTLREGASSLKVRLRSRSLVFIARGASTSAGSSPLRPFYPPTRGARREFKRLALWRAAGLGPALPPLILRG